jgi:hypothetical protein
MFEMEADSRLPAAVVQLVQLALHNHSTGAVEVIEFVQTTRHAAERALESGSTAGDDVRGWLIQAIGSFVGDRAPVGVDPPRGAALHLFVSHEGRVLDFGIGGSRMDLAPLGRVDSLDVHEA